MENLEHSYSSNDLDRLYPAPSPGMLLQTVYPRMPTLLQILFHWLQLVGERKMGVGVVRKEWCGRGLSAGGEKRVK